MNKPVNLTSRLSYIQSRFKSKKSRYNSFGKYYFRSAEDILEAIKPFLDEHSITVRIEEEFIDGSVPVIKSKAIISDGIDEIASQAIVGVDLNQKGMQVPQQFGSASSYGKKYALGNLLLIDDTQDADAMNDHGQSKQKLSGVALEKAKEYIKNGGSIDSIKSKYDISSAVEKQLQTL
jgi:hypothetical protein